MFIFTLALFLRTYQLENFPVGFHSDEARVAWNAYSILKTGKDDRGNVPSLYYDTFGDYRPTGIFYFTIPSILVFGRNEFAVRFPSALFGALTVFPLYLFVTEIFKNKNLQSVINGKKLAIVSSLLLAISPWHIEVSRATSEVGISTFFALSAIYFLVKLIKNGGRLDAYIACGLITISFLLYHAIRFLAPIFFITIILFYFREFKSSKRKKFILGSLIFVFSLTIFFSTTPEARKRFDQVSIFKDENTNYEIKRLEDENKKPNLTGRIIYKKLDSKYVIYAKRFLLEYPTYFSSNFLIGYSARPYRYATPGAGLFTFFEFGLLIIGLVEAAKGKKNLLPLLLLLIAPLPAALTTEDAPNLHRAFFMVPFLMTIETYGLLSVIDFSKKYKNLVKSIVFIAMLISTTYFLHMYFDHSSFHMPFIKEFNLDGSSYRNIGTKDLVLRIEKLKGQYDKVVVNNSTDDPYPWYAFFTGKDPAEFNKYAIKRKDGPWQYQNIIFSRLKCPTDSAFTTEKEQNLLVIDAGAPDCAYEAKINDGLQAKVVDKILRPSGSEVYVLLERK